MKTKVVPVMALHFGEDNSIEITGIYARKAAWGTREAEPFPFPGVACLDCGESVTLRNVGGVLRVSKRVEDDE